MSLSLLGEVGGGCDRHPVFRQRTCLVRTNHGDGTHRL